MGRKPSVNHNLLPHMRARQRRGSGKTFYYYDTGAKPRKEIPLGCDYVLAVQKWAKLNLSPSPALPTVGYAIGQYMISPEYTALGSDTQKDYKYALDKLAAKFGDGPLDNVSTKLIKLYHRDRSEESIHRARREVQILGMLFRWARGAELTKNDPTEPIKLKGLPGRKNVEITDDMLDAVYVQGVQPLKDAIDLAYYMSQRPADVLKASETDIKDGFIFVRQNKTGMPLRIEIEGGLAQTIERIQARKRTYAVRSLALLVDEHGKQMTKHMLRARFENAREAAGIDGKDFQFRDLRRKGGSDTRDENGLEAAQALLGHASVVMTEHYTGGRGKKVSATPMRREPKKRSSNGNES